LTQTRLARRIGSDRAYVSRVEGGAASPTFDWATRAMAAMGEELVLDVQRSRFDDHDPHAHRTVGGWDGDRRLADFLASTKALDALTRTES
jgi:transcriptional regulator with XRE-family HTH domain